MLRHPQRHFRLRRLMGSLVLALFLLPAACTGCDARVRPNPNPSYQCPKPAAPAGTVALEGIGYGPYHTGQDPNTGSMPSAAEVQDDIATLRAYTNNVRIYGAGGPSPYIVQAARQAHLCVNQGIWLGKDAGANATEIANGEQLAAKNPAVRMLTVGNEVLLRGDLSEAQLTADIDKVRGEVDHSIPISTADVFQTWLAHPELAQHVDVITVHIYPFWSGVSIDSALTFVQDAYNQLRQTFGTKKPIVIGETGWPSDGPPQGAAVPSPENQARYLQEFTTWAQHTNVSYYFFDFADEGWKQSEQGVGNHWGLLQENGQLKPALQNLLPPPDPQTLFDRSMRDVYVGSALEAPFQLGIDTSSHQFGWVTQQPVDQAGQAALQLTYPANQQWGALFITVGAAVPPGKRQSMDFSAYQSLSVDLQGAAGGECVQLGVKDAAQPDNGSETKVSECLTTSWATYAIPLSTFTQAHVQHLYVVFEVVFGGAMSMTIQMRNVRYSPQPANGPVPTPTGQPTATPTPGSPPTTAPTVPPTVPSATPTPLPTSFAVYTDYGLASNHYVPSGFMGDYGAITMNSDWTQNPHSGSSCIQVIYTGKTPQNQGWAGVYWQDPQNNWGNLQGGFNLSRYPHLTFWVRGAVGGEQIEFKVGGITGTYGDSLQPAFSTGVITLSTKWQRVTLDLTGKNLTHIIGGFVWVANTTEDPNGATFYLDDIVYSAS